MGVTDVYTHVIETVEQIKERIKRRLQVSPPERLYIDPDCGLKTRTEEESLGKLHNMMTAVREVKKEMGIE